MELIILFLMNKGWEPIANSNDNVKHCLDIELATLFIYTDNSAKVVLCPDRCPATAHEVLLIREVTSDLPSQATAFVEWAIWMER